MDIGNIRFISSINKYFKRIVKFFLCKNNFFSWLSYVLLFSTLSKLVFTPQVSFYKIRLHKFFVLL